MQPIDPSGSGCGVFFDFCRIAAEEGQLRPGALGWAEPAQSPCAAIPRNSGPLSVIAGGCAAVGPALQGRGMAFASYQSCCIAMKKAGIIRLPPLRWPEGWPKSARNDRTPLRPSPAALTGTRP
ncbi:hypothetical protein NSU_4186 [Novosphingobium pentaromativorans US6-1]|uniref:Uncharacterized protein n=1 Tax=Novosphingobium pentaromativorans US6-1 TaxID=1088721 RepID=G6EIL5_9SPHN|nr:hypothetical protein NSU_4186 [Novosphingobium pentaromativorans US6-1]